MFVEIAALVVSIYLHECDGSSFSPPRLDHQFVLFMSGRNEAPNHTPQIVQ